MFVAANYLKQLGKYWGGQIAESTLPKGDHSFLGRKILEGNMLGSYSDVLWEVILEGNML